MAEQVIPTKEMPPGLQVDKVDDRIMTLNVGPQHPGSGHMRIIVKIDGLLTKEMSLDDAAKQIRGPKGTDVILSIKRFGILYSIHSTPETEIIILYLF